MSFVKHATPVALDLDREGKIDDGITQDITIPEHDGTPFFEAGDGDLQLWVGKECFETHKYLIKRFSGLKGLLRTHNTTTTLHVPSGLGRYNSVDFYRTLRVLYTTILEGSLEFDSDTLVSALRIATVFDYPALRAYAIQYLEHVQLSAIERIKAAREFGLAPWEEPAYLELCDRDEAITMEEASVLGMDAFVRVAGIREREQRRRGREVDVQQARERAEDLGPVGSTSGPANVDGAGSSAQPIREPSSSNEAGDPPTQINTVTDFKPSFIDVQLGHDYANGNWYLNPATHLLPVPGCECRVLNSSGWLYAQKMCKVAPCVAMAIKNVQIQQVAHTNTIVRLQSSLDGLTATNPSNSTCSKLIIGSNTRISVQEEVRRMILALQAPRSQA